MGLDEQHASWIRKQEYVGLIDISFATRPSIRDILPRPWMKCLDNDSRLRNRLNAFMSR